MRYLKLASAENPYTDFIELNDLNGFLCTSFQTVGMNRKLDFLAIKNRRLVVENKVDFKKYNLSIEILSKYSEYEQKHREFISFIDRNKKSGFRLYYKPYEGMDERYCLCIAESSLRTEKRQPIFLILCQCSLWYSEEKNVGTGKGEAESGNIFSFDDDGSGYYSVGFNLDEEITNYYCVKFLENVFTVAEFENKSYNNIPLRVRIYGNCSNPTIQLYDKNSNELLKKTQIFVDVPNGFYIEIIPDIIDCGVWLVNQDGEKEDISVAVNNEFGSPYFFIENGEYLIKVSDENTSPCTASVYYQEEYSE